MSVATFAIATVDGRIIVVIVDAVVIVVVVAVFVVLLGVRSVVHLP